MKPFAVVFAGVPGSSKSIVANYLSGKFGLSYFSNDQLRYEVREDLQVDNINIPEALEEFEKRLTNRIDEFLSIRNPIIIDGSVDRRWPERKQQLTKHGYDWFLINMELSRPFVEDLFRWTGRAELTSEYLDKYFQMHKDFMREYGNEVSLTIHDNDFPRRLDIAAKALQEFIGGQTG